MASQKSLSDELGNATSTELATLSQKRLKPNLSWANGKPETFKSEKVVPVEGGLNGEHKVCRTSPYTCNALGFVHARRGTHVEPRQHGSTGNRLFEGIFSLTFRMWAITRWAGPAILG